MKRMAVVTAVAGVLTMAHSAHAQRWLVDGQVGVGSGFEGGNPVSGVDWQRARTRVLAGVDLAIDESTYHSWQFRLFAEIERSASLGAEFRYVRWVSPTVGLNAGLKGVIAPKTLFGGGFGATFLIPLNDDLDVFLEPQIDILPLGGDLPDGSVLLWGLMTGGVRVDF